MKYFFIFTFSSLFLVVISANPVSVKDKVYVVFGSGNSAYIESAYVLRVGSEFSKVEWNHCSDCSEWIKTSLFYYSYNSAKKNVDRMDTNDSFIREDIIHLLGAACIINNTAANMGWFFNITKHKYYSIETIEEIDRLKKMKTYVLFPHNLSSSHSKSKKYKRYQRVLDLIQELPKYDENLSNLESINNFILMGKKNQEEKITIDTYNYKLASTIINIFQKKLKDQSFNGEGAFLVTTMDHILRDDNISALVVDLSEFNNSAIDEIINSYKKRLIDTGNSKFTILEKLKFRILSLVTNANDNIYIIRQAVAGD